MNSVEEVTVVDVYDLASDVGKEFEKIIDKNGPNSVADLIPKVINILELLETLAVRREGECALVQELNDKICQLENDKQEKAEFKKKIDKVSLSIRNPWVRCCPIYIPTLLNLLFSRDIVISMVFEHRPRREYSLR